MAATTGKTGMGAKLLLGDGASPEVFTEVANVVSMEVGGMTLELVDATHLGSPNQLREWLASLKSAQAWNMTIQWDPTHATHDASTGLRSKLDNRTKTNVRMDPTLMGFTDGLQASGYFTEIGNISISVDGVATQTLTYQPTGDVTEYDFS